MTEPTNTQTMTLNERPEMTDLWRARRQAVGVAGGYLEGRFDERARWYGTTPDELQTIKHAAEQESR